MTDKDGDPFDCFGSSDDEDDCNENQKQAEEIENNFQKNKRTRPSDCGVLSFHSSTESSLLIHVQNFMQQKEQRNLLGNDVNKDRATDLVCMAINEYCEERHWMMHVGPEKGKIVIDTLHKCMLEKTNRDDTRIEDFVCVELGTYCGYASILMASVLKNISSMKTIMQEKPKLLTVEINPTFQKIAKNLVGLANVHDYVKFLSLDLNFDGTTQDVSKLLKEEINKTKSHEKSGIQRKIDFLFIDHDKDLYLHDLKLLKNQDLIQPGTTVVADNVVFAQIDDYISYMKELSKQGVVTTKTVPAVVEYSSQQCLSQDETNKNLLQDGLEVTTFL